MSCQKIRESIESGAGLQVLSSHLDGCVSCERHFQEHRSLLALLREQPRVEAPSDFEFRVRAGIARARAAQSEPASVSLGRWLLSGRLSLSWIQTTAVAAALAAVVTVTAYRYTQYDQMTAPTLATESGVSTSLVAVNQPGAAAIRQSTVVAANVIKAPLSAPRVPVSSTSIAGREVALAAGSLAVSAVEPSEADSVSTGGASLKVFNSERGQMISASSQMTLIGAESSSPLGSSAVGQGARSVGYVPSI
ncbi:MAG: hypothetical protein EBU88_03765 [Acidobacteria bacterium]|nr:hypothetical protein [Acidobacteriota bacterium]